jgi:DHA2 family methylenomycin A resistance protein-like MFS transporter
MCVGYFLVLLDVTIVNVALPKIGTGLHANVSALQWVVDGYALALAALMLAGGTMGDLSGHKRIVLSGLIVFGLGSVGCGLAPDVGVLIAARVAQGLGAAMLLPGTLAIISRAFPDGPAQAKAIGVWAGIGSLALPAGPLLGGALIAGFGWRAIFLINVPIVLAALVVAVTVVRESTDRQGRRLDLAGVALGIGVLTTITFAFIEGGHLGAGSPAVIAAGIAALGLLAAFLAVEHGQGEQAMLPLTLFRRSEFSVANGAAWVMNLGSLGSIFVLTLFLQSTQGHSPLTAGLAVIPLFAPLAVISPLAGRLNSRTGPRLPVALGFVLAAAGLALLSVSGRDTSYLLFLPAFLLWGTGLGVVTPAVVAAAIAAVPADRAGLASAINNTARQSGGAIGIAVAGAIAGEPTAGSRFVSGFHGVALGAACLYVVTALAAGFLIPGKASERRSHGQHRGEAATT